MTDSPELQPIREVLRPLALLESDFQVGDAVVERLAELKVAIDGIKTDLEPWLLEWLADEHYKGSVLFAAAKVNWSHEQHGKATLAGRQERAQIVARFNLWVDQLSTRLVHYEKGRRDAVSVAAWRSELALFKQDPVRND
ncbi:hypothetical protein [Arthrobacter sp. NPDC093139]|uniref:hypothetical protein n=1 Tax=Arthrobacter sp. NPDC093139 TaxID=3363945 RepID=UPI0037FDCE46